MTTVFSGSGSTGSAVQANGSTGATAVQATSDSGYAISGTSTSGNAGVSGINNSAAGSGVVGTSASGTGTGVTGVSTSGAGVVGQSNSGYGVSGTSSSGYGVSGTSTSGHAGVYGTSGTSGVIGETTSTNASDSGILGRNTGAGPGVTGTSSSGYGVSGTSTGGLAGVYGTSGRNGVLGKSASTTDSGVLGQNTGAGAGVTGTSTSGTGVVGIGPTGGLAGNFIGNVNVQGTINKSALTFKIDHPLDPAQKYLFHAGVESAEMKNIYDGVVVLDAGGEAVVDLPAWFEALNTEFRYQLTCIGGYAPIYIAQEVQCNRFKIAGGKAGMKVSWLLTGIRQDPYALAHPLVVEEEKPQEERGYYRHPELYGEPEEMGTVWANYPEQMRLLK